jgi:hypothetical protein
MSTKTILNNMLRSVRKARPVVSALPGSSRQPFHTASRLLKPAGFSNIFDAENMADPARPRLQVNKLNDQGFHLSDGLIIPGGVIFVDDRAFLWDVDPIGVEKETGRGVWRGWDKERFRIFETVMPRPGRYFTFGYVRRCKLTSIDFHLPEILLLGTGATVLPPPPEIRSYISSLGIQLDVMDSVRTPIDLDMWFRSIYRYVTSHRETPALPSTCSRRKDELWLLR